MAFIDTYTAGTVTLTNGSAVVTGSSTNWIAGGLGTVSKGHLFCYGAFTAAIKSVDSATQITLYAPFSGTTVAGASYEVLRYSRVETPEVVGYLQQLLTKGQAANPFSRLDMDSGAVRASFRDDGAGNLGWYVGTTGAADGSQVKAATVNKATGNVGIGTASPGNLLHIAGTMRIDGSDVNYAIHSGATRRGYLRGESGGLSLVAEALPLILAATGANPLSVQTNGAERFRVDSSGNVGLGISSPGAKLHVFGATANVASGYFPSAYIGRPLDVGGNRTLEIGNFAYTTYLQTTDTGSTIGDLILNPRGGNVFVGAPLLPFTDNVHPLGGGANRWSVVYAGTGTINTSDAREKTAIRPLNAAELRAAQRLAMEIGVYQWLEAVKEKGDAARQHVGMTVQRAIEIMEDEGLDPWSYGFMCRDEITRKVKTIQKRMVQKVEEVEVSYAEIEVRDGSPVQVTKTRTDKQPVTHMAPVVSENGKPVLTEDGQPLMHAVPVMAEEDVEVEIDEPAGDRLGFRPDQIDRFIMRGLAEKIALLEGK